MFQVKAQIKEWLTKMSILHNLSKIKHEYFKLTPKIHKFSIKKI
jgi:hypothetical protein